MRWRTGHGKTLFWPLRPSCHKDLQVYPNLGNYKPKINFIGQLAMTEEVPLAHWFHAKTLQGVPGFARCKVQAAATCFATSKPAATQKYTILAVETLGPHFRAPLPPG